MCEKDLKMVASIYSGLVLQRFGLGRRYSNNRKTVSPSDEKSYYHIPLKAVEDNKIDLNLLETIKVEKEVNKRYLLKNGDIIMKLSPPFSAAMINFDCENLIGSSPFAIIRTSENIDPMYMTYVLNGKNVRKQLNRLVEGGTLAIIKINYLNQVKIPYRNLEDQIKYAKLLSLLSKRKNLRMKTVELEDSIIEKIISEL